MNDDKIEWATLLLTVDVTLLPMFKALPPSPSFVEALQIILQFLRAHEISIENLRNMPNEARGRSVAKRLAAAVGRIRSPIPIPDLAPPFRVLRTIAELQKAAQSLRNCVGIFDWHGDDYSFRLARGELILIQAEQPAVLAAVRQAAPGLWYISEMAGYENRSVGADISRGLTMALEDVGIKVLSMSPGQALRCIGRYAYKNNAPAEEGDEDLEELVD